MTLPKSKIPLSITIDGNVNRILDIYSKRYDISKSKFTRNIMYNALRDFKILHKTGVLTAGKILNTFFESVLGIDIDANYSFEIDTDTSPATITVIIDSDVREVLQKYSKHFDLPVKMFARNLIYVGLDNFKVLERYKLVQLSKYSRAFKCFVNSYLDES